MRCELCEWYERGLPRKNPEPSTCTKKSYSNAERQANGFSWSLWNKKLGSFSDLLCRVHPPQTAQARTCKTGVFWRWLQEDANLHFPGYWVCLTILKSNYLVLMILWKMPSANLFQRDHSLHYKEIPRIQGKYKPDELLVKAFLESNFKHHTYTFYFCWLPRTADK